MCFTTPTVDTQASVSLLLLPCLGLFFSTKTRLKRTCIFAEAGGGDKQEKEMRHFHELMLVLTQITDFFEEQTLCVFFVYDHLRACQLYLEPVFLVFTLNCRGIF